jgi:hypothetical protein
LFHGLDQSAIPSFKLFDATFASRRPNRLDDIDTALTRLLQKPFKAIRMLGGRHPHGQARFGWRETRRLSHREEDLSLFQGQDFRREYGTTSIGQLHEISGLGAKHLHKVTGFIYTQRMGAGLNVRGKESAHAAKKKRRAVL